MNCLVEEKENITDEQEAKRKKLNLNNYVEMSAIEFQNKVLAGEITDDTGLAILCINGSPSNYNIHVGRRCVTRSDGSLITLVGILKMYSIESLSVRIIKRKRTINRRVLA